MIGKPKWFTYRIFGWGLRPKTKEGWIYIILAASIISLITMLPIPANYKTYVITGIAVVIVIDAMHIMTQLGKHHDEREKYHQLIIERNCSFAAIATIVGIVIYQSVTTPNNLDYNLLIVLGAMVLTKIISWIYVSRKL